MGQANENEKPELILEKLKSCSIHDENNLSLDKSFYTIKKILTDYKFYKDILKNNNNNNRKAINNSQKHKYNSNHEFSKAELSNIGGDYDKIVIQDINHKIERIKKWVKMGQYPYLKDNKEENFDENYQSVDDNLDSIMSKDNDNDNIKERSSKKFNSSNDLKRFKDDTINDKNNNNKIILSNYTDKKIENGITEFCKNQKKKFVERLKKGPPDCFRWASWCIINNLPLDRENVTYENYTNMVLEKENKDRIIRDIERTFSEKNIEKKELRKMEASLYKVLKAFWNLDKEIGYCQGMNLLVGFLLIMSDFNERDTFFVLISSFSNTFKLRQKYDYSFRGLFSEEFPLLRFLNYIFECLLEEYAKELKNHLENMGISVDIWMSKWFQTLFTIILPISWCKRLWDNIFAKNIFFMVKFGIAFTLMIKDDLMKMEEEVEILDYFKKFENYSLCSENDLLNSKSDIFSLILKCKKYKIDVEQYVKNYEKKESGFLNKMIKIENVKYDFYGELVKKQSMETILFSDDENNNENISPNSGTFRNKPAKKNNINNNSNTKINNEFMNNEEIIFEEDKNEKENRKDHQINKELQKKNSMKENDYLVNEIIPTNQDYSKKQSLTERNLRNNKLSTNSKNKNNDNNINNDIIIDNNSNDNNRIKEIKHINNLNNIIHFNNNSNSLQNDNIKEEDNNVINNINDNYMNENLSVDSINNSYYLDVEENIINDETNNNILEYNIYSHQFDNFLNKNKLEDLPSNKIIMKDELNFVPTLREKKESFGIHIPIGDDISSFIGKKKFSKFKIKEENGINSNRTMNQGNNGIIFDKGKIKQFC